MAIDTYKCRWCHQRFPRENPKGRLPRACPEHRKAVKSLHDRLRRRQPKRVYPQCCLDAPGRVCPQHTQFRRFKYYWHHYTVPTASKFLDSFK